MSFEVDECSWSGLNEIRCVVECQFASHECWEREYLLKTEVGLRDGSCVGDGIEGDLDVREGCAIRNDGLAEHRLNLLTERGNGKTCEGLDGGRVR